jgi:c-di-GMP-related signal transduction protein
MEEIVHALPLREEIRMALLGSPVRERCLLDWLDFHEHGDWKFCDAIANTHNLSQQNLLACYEKAIVWAESALRLA